ncbi:MAG TPA: TonB-dependent receptor [Vicinamibacterales bacterium]|nr:TonB-dependent receptor [Vicinamibacterales bacterium]
MERTRAGLGSLVVIVAALIATPALAQKTTGDITGAVADATGGMIPGAAVTAVCGDTGFTRNATTDAQGGYSIPELPICVYRVSVELQGFKTVAREVQVAVNTLAKVDFKLEVGTQSETVTVQGVSPLVEFSDKLNNSVDRERIEQIPLSGRDFNSLLAVTPGVQRAGGGGFLAINISGARTTSNNYMLDGISNNDRYYGDSVLNQTGVVGVPATLVPMDAIAEFNVQQTPSAEFGVKGGGAINMVMKSGTNQLHGSSYYFRHDDWTDSPNFFVQLAADKAGTAASSTPVKNQQYGGTFGGPIEKDRTFFFGYYEGQRLSVISPYSVHVPTTSQISAARARISAAGLTTNPIGENLLKYFPTDPSGQLTVQTPNVANMNTFSGKIDRQMNANNLINGRFFWGSSLQSAPASSSALTPANGPADMFNSVTDPTRVMLAGFVWNSTISSHTLLETRFGFNSISQTIGVNNSVDPASLGLNTGPLDAANFGVPGVSVGGFGTIGGVTGYPITTSPTTNTEVSSAVTHTVGGHTLKMGANYQYAYNRSVRDRARTGLVATGGTSSDLDSLVGLLLGRFDSAARAFGQTERHMHQTTLGIFINDEWKASSRLTLSAGLRYELFLPITERDNLASNFFPDRGLVQVGHGINSLYNASNNFGPRAGVAWDVMGDGRTSVRAGYALTYDAPQFATIHSPGVSRPGGFTNLDQGVFSVSLSGATRVAPDSPAATCVNPNNVAAGGDYICAQPGVPLYGSSPTGAPPFDVFSIPMNLRAPMYHYFHATFQREVFRNNAVTISYVGSRGMDQILARDINAPVLGSAFANPLPLRPFYAQYPNFNHIYQLTNDGRSWYDSMQVSWRQNNWHGINTQYNYTLANCQDLNSSNRGTGTDGPQADNPYNPAANKGPCTFDVRHNFNMSGTYAIPSAAALGALGRGWEIGSVFTAYTGRPFTPSVGSFDRSGQNTGWLRANCLADPIYNYDPLVAATTGIVTNAAQAFATPPNGTLGTCGRDVGRRPGLQQWDMNILKLFRVQNATIQARWEIFNLLNHVNLAGLQSTSIRSSSFGLIGSTPDVAAGNPVIAQGGPRAMQWAVKVLF